jgi:hypothetical protein
MPLRSAKSNNTQSVRIGGEFIKGAVIPRLKYPLDDSSHSQSAWVTVSRATASPAVQARAQHDSSPIKTFEKS